MKNLDNWKDGEVRVLAHEVEMDTWAYPQMGGYASKSTFTFDCTTGSAENEPGCFGVDVWHDGEWPFTGEKRGKITGKCEVCDHPYEYPAESPSHLHHCAAEQFVEFGLLVLETQVQHQQRLDKTGLVRVDRVWRDAMVKRLLALPVSEKP